MGSSWVGIAANARSGIGTGPRKVRRLERALERHGLEPRVAWTLAERAALLEQARTDPACRCLVAVGGDGTVADVFNACPTVPVTVLPAGTENLFARHFGLRGRSEALAEAIASGHTCPLDLGLAGGRRFALMAGFGFDADVVTRHHRARALGGTIRRTHRAAYIAPVLRASVSYRFPALTLRAAGPDGEEVLTGTTAFLFNLPRYALGLPFAPTASGSDGLLDLVVFRDPGPWRALQYLWLVLRRLHLRRPGVFHRRVRRVTVSTAGAVPVQLDGDPGGRVDPGRSWTVEVLPHAANVLVPSANAIVRVPD
jgi:diacylglycerol kinase family enzyme